jgi:dienelactone hydrolase
MKHIPLLLLLLAAATPAQTPDFSARGAYGDTYRVADIPGTTEVMSASRIYYPDSAGTFPPSAVPAPIVVFGHGWQMGIDRYYSYAQHLASWGYVVVLPTISNPLIVPDHYARARLMIDAARYAAALDTMPGDAFLGRLDRWNWGFAGHSMGGGLAMLAADTFGLLETLRVAIAIHSPQTTPPTHAAHVLQPKLVLAGGVDNIAPWNDVRSAYWAGTAPSGTFGVIAGANHGYVMDYSYFWENGGTATITREEQQRTIRRHLTAFLERYLHGDSSDWNFSYTYGDSVLQSPAFDSVEVLLPPVSVESPFIELTNSLDSSPNPVRGRAFIRYGLASAGPVSLAVFDAQGRLVKQLVRSHEPAGTHDAVWQPDSGLPGGTYFLRLSAPGITATRLLVLAR